MATQRKKVYVLDTNVLIHDPFALFGFEDEIVGIPVIVLEELDKFKKEGTDRGRNTRETVRQLDALRERGMLSEGVRLDNGGTLKILFPPEKAPKTPFKLTEADNEILLALLVEKEAGYDVTFISKDLNARVKAAALGIKSEDYTKEHVTESEFYHGWICKQVPSVQLKSDSPKILNDLIKEYNFVRHEFALLESNNNPFNYKIFRYIGDKGFRPVLPPQLKWPLKARNSQQQMALDVLLDDSIQFVTLFGPAGTGKTFLALLAGLHKVLIEDQYESMLISRPVVPLGRDIGYLPGDIQEKMHSWMMPIYDNMDFIVNSIKMPEETYVKRFDKFEKDRFDKDKKHKHKYDDKREKRRAGKMMSIQDLIRAGKMSLEPITYMRGRSIPYRYIIIDEAQNLTPHEVKTIVSRVGEGSKIILAGDPYQIDSPYLTFSDNGLVAANEKFKGQGIFASVYLQTTERSELSELASRLL